MKDFPFVQGLADHVKLCESRPMGEPAQPTVERTESGSDNSLSNTISSLANSSINNIVTKLYEGGAGREADGSPKVIVTPTTPEETITIVQPTAPEESPNYSGSAGDYAFELGERAGKDNAANKASAANKEGNVPNGEKEDEGQVGVPALFTITDVRGSSEMVADEDKQMEENVDYTVELQSQGSQDSDEKDE